MPPAPLDAAIVFAPAGELVPAALEAVGRGGTVSCAGIYMTQIPPLDYERHLFYERTLRSVTSNTRQDGEELMRLAARIPLVVHTRTVGMDGVAQGLADLAHGRGAGSVVVQVGESPGLLSRSQPPGEEPRVDRRTSNALAAPLRRGLQFAHDRLPAGVAQRFAPAPRGVADRGPRQQQPMNS